MIKSANKLKKEAWSEFSKYIRLRSADKEGNVICVTCGKKLHWKESQASHFIDSRCNSVLFNEKIVHPACYRCNVILHGNKVKYFLYMKSIGYTDKQLEIFEMLKNKPLKYTKQDYIDISDKYKAKVEMLKKKKKV